MSNNYFRFKQFTIHQDKCAMKVCTDACLFGAWSAFHSPLTTHHSLDIGTGTGVLSLMFAQQNQDVEIDAVEIDTTAAGQAKENFQASPWKERLNIYNSSIREFADRAKTNYDLIISNPPFYENDLKSDDQKRNLALHSAALTLEGLMDIADILLKDDGNFFVLLPHHRTENCIQLSRQKFFVKEKIFIQQTSRHNYFRSILWLSRQPAITAQSYITIMNDAGKYTDEFIALLKDYYLYL
ncbi:MAG TPA: methyltransferase [Parafilimonas sp.]|nr:methyltransferase [Parafilimonas sp.]